MKKIFLIMLLSGFLFTAFSQVMIKIPVVSDSVAFFNSPTSETITLGKNEFLAASYWAQGSSLVVRIQVYESIKAAWYWLNEDDERYVHSMDSTYNNYIVSPPWLMLSAKTVRYWIDNTPSDTFYVRYEKRPY